MPRLIAFALLVAAALPAAAQDADPAGDADLGAAREFAAFLERIGEPSVASLTFVIAWAHLAPDPVLLRAASLEELCEIPGWVLSREGGTLRLLCEDGLVWSLRLPRRLSQSRNSSPEPEIPPGCEAWTLRRKTEWWTDGRRFRDTCRGEPGAWRLAHWAAWHVQLEDDGMAVACWRAAMEVLGSLPVEFPRATAGDRLALAAARTLARSGMASDDVALSALERLQAMAREELDADVAAEVRVLAQKLDARSASLQAARASRREAEAARTAWIGGWLQANLSDLSRHQQAECWIRRLVTEEAPELGSAHGAAILDAHDRLAAGPCRELVALGMDALPALVASACEPWPTSVRRGGRAVTVGDLCALLVERIAGAPMLPRGPDELLPDPSLDPERRRAIVAEWWRELGPLEAESRWLVLWKRGSETAVKELLLRDAARYLPDIVGRTDRETGRKRELKQARLAHALRALPESRLRELERSLSGSCAEVVREAMSR